MKSEKITKVKFRDGGLGGMVVYFEKPTKRSKENFRDDYKVTYKAPLHPELLAQKEKLTEHLRDICRLHDNVNDEEISLTEISSNAYDQFNFKGTVRTIGETISPLKTPNIQDGTGYAKFLDVIEIVGDLYDEVRSYIHLDKKAQVDLVQVAMDFAAKDKKADVDEIGGMTPDQKENYAREYLQSKGYITIQFEDPGDGPAVEVLGNAGDDGGPTDEEIDGGNPRPGSQEEAADYFKENPEGLFPENREESESNPPQQPGFGAPAGGTVIPITQPVKDPDDAGEARKRARSIR